VYDAHELPEPAFTNVQPVGGQVSNPSFKLVLMLPEVVVKLIEEPIHGVVVLAEAVIVGGVGFTVTVTVAVDEQPAALVPVTV
jgi:hypothetical protein